MVYGNIYKNPVQSEQGFNPRDEKRDYDNVLDMATKQYDATWGSMLDEHRRKYVLGESLRTAGMVMDAPANPVKGAYVESSENTRKFIDSTTKMAGMFNVLRKIPKAISEPPKNLSPTGLAIWGLKTLVPLGWSYITGSTAGRQAATATSAIVDPGTRAGYFKGMYFNPKGFNYYELQDVKPDAGFFESMLFEMQSDPLDLIAPSVRHGVRQISNEMIANAPKIAAYQSDTIAKGMADIQYRANYGRMNPDSSFNSLKVKQQVGNVFRDSDIPIPSSDVLNELSEDILKRTTSNTLTGLETFNKFGEVAQRTVAKAAWWTNPVGFSVLAVPKRLTKIYNFASQQNTKAYENVTELMTRDDALYVPDMKVASDMDAFKSVDTTFGMFRESISDSARGFFPNKLDEFKEHIRFVRDYATSEGIDEVTAMKGFMEDAGFRADDMEIQDIFRVNDDLLAKQGTHAEQVHRHLIKDTVRKVRGVIDEAVELEEGITYNVNDIVANVMGKINETFDANLLEFNHLWRDEALMGDMLRVTLRRYGLSMDDFKLATYNIISKADASQITTEQWQNFAAILGDKNIIQTAADIKAKGDKWEGLTRLYQPYTYKNLIGKNVTDKQLIRNISDYSKRLNVTSKGISEFLELEGAVPARVMQVKHIDDVRKRTKYFRLRALNEGVRDTLGEVLYNGKETMDKLVASVRDTNLLKAEIAATAMGETPDMNVLGELIDSYKRAKSFLDKDIEYLKYVIKQADDVDAPIRLREYQDQGLLDKSFDIQKIMDELDNMLTETANMDKILEPSKDFFELFGKSDIFSEQTTHAHRHLSLLNALESNGSLEKLLQIASEDTGTGALMRVVKKLLDTTDDELSLVMKQEMELIERFAKSTKNYLELSYRMNTIPDEYAEGVNVIMDYIHSNRTRVIRPAEIMTEEMFQAKMLEHIGKADFLGTEIYTHKLIDAIKYTDVYAYARNYAEQQALIGARSVQLPDKYFKSTLYSFEQSLKDVLDPSGQLKLDLDAASERDLIKLVGDLTGSTQPLQKTQLKDVDAAGLTNFKLGTQEGSLAEGTVLGLKAASNHYDTMWYTGEELTNALNKKLKRNLTGKQYRLYLRSTGLDGYNSTLRYVYKGDVKIRANNVGLYERNPIGLNQINRDLDILSKRIEDIDIESMVDSAEMAKIIGVAEKLGFSGMENVPLMGIYMKQHAFELSKILGIDYQLIKEWTKDLDGLNSVFAYDSAIRAKKRAGEALVGDMINEIHTMRDLDSLLSQRLHARESILQRGSIKEVSEAVNDIAREIVETSKDPELLMKSYDQIYRTGILQRAEIATYIEDLNDLYTKVGRRRATQMTDDIMRYNINTILNAPAEEIAAFVDKTEGFLIIRNPKAYDFELPDGLDKYGLEVHIDDTTLLIAKSKNLQAELKSNAKVKYARSLNPEPDSMRDHIQRVLKKVDRNKSLEPFEHGDFVPRTHTLMRANQLAEEMRLKFGIELDVDEDYFSRRIGPRFNFTEYGTTDVLKLNDAYAPSDAISSTMNSVATMNRATGARDKYIQQFFNDHWNVNTSPIWEQFDDKQLYNVLKTNSDRVKAVTLIKKKGRILMREIPITDRASTIEVLRGRNSIIVPVDAYMDMYKIINEYKLQDMPKIMEVWNKTVTQTYKTFYLATVGFPVRNMLDSVYKNMQQGGGFVDLPDTVRNIAKAHDMLNFYDKHMDNILDKFGSAKIGNIHKYVKEAGLTPIEEDMLIFTKMFHDSSAAGNMSESVANFYNAKNFGKAKPKKWYDKYSNALWQVPKKTGLYKVSSMVENSSRLGLILQQMELGEEFSTAVNKAVEAHFNYATKTMEQIYGESFIPFLTFPLKNLAYHSNKMANDPSLTKYLLDSQTAGWFGPEDDDEKMYRTRSKMYHLSAGNINLGEHIFKLNPSFFDATKLTFSPQDELAGRLIEPIKWATKALQGQKHDIQLPAEYNVKMVADTLKGKKPILPSLFSYNRYYKNNTNNQKHNKRVSVLSNESHETPNKYNIQANSTAYKYGQK